MLVQEDFDNHQNGVADAKEDELQFEFAIVRGHGIAGLYTGLGASLLNQGGKTGVQFAAYQFWRESLGPLGLEAGGLAFCAGASAAPRR